MDWLDHDGKQVGNCLCYFTGFEAILEILERTEFQGTRKHRPDAEQKAKNFKIIIILFG